MPEWGRVEAFVVNGLNTKGVTKMRGASAKGVAVESEVANDDDVETWRGHAIGGGGAGTEKVDVKARAGSVAWRSVGVAGGSAGWFP